MALCCGDTVALQEFYKFSLRGTAIVRDSISDRMRRYKGFIGRISQFVDEVTEERFFSEEVVSSLF
ncbi:hypothetical protein EGU64_32220 [Achromobacter denitrificans]|nr:hypothetical protein EGU64_32220 [Achromobacter denitrificans]